MGTCRPPVRTAPCIPDRSRTRRLFVPRVAVASAHRIPEKRQLYKLGYGLFLLLLISLLVWPWPVLAAPAVPPFPDLVPVPEGDTRVILNAFTVDATLVDAGTAASWQVVVRARLHNPSPSEEAAIRLVPTTTGDAPLPDDLRFALGRDETQARPLSEATVDRTLRPDERLWLTFVYSVPAGSLPWTRFYYGVNRLAAWPSVVGSVRVSLHLPQQLDREVFLRISPDTTAYNGLLVEWQWEERVPPVPTDVLLIRPSLWQDIVTLRAAAASGDAQATARLARLLSDLVAADKAPQEVVEDFYSQALAAWAALADMRPDDPQPWREMAALYEIRARTSEDPETYTPLVLAALEEAWARGDRDDLTRQHLADVIREQVDHLIAEARWQDALSAAQRLREVLGAEGEREVQDLRHRIALAWARDRAAAGDRPGLREALNAGWGEAVAAYFLPRQPPLRYLALEVTTREREREIVITAALDTSARPDPRETWATFVRLLRAALPDNPIEAEEKGSLVRVRARVPFDTAADLLAAQKRIVGIVPDGPAWALVREGLSPTRLEMEQEPTLWGWRHLWREEVNLSPARAALDEVVAGLRVAMLTPPASDFPDDLLPLLRQERERDLLAWQGLRDEMSAVYVLRWEAPPGPPLARRWHLAVGEHVVMQGERSRPNVPRLALLGGLLLLAWTLVTLGLWRLLGRP